MPQVVYFRILSATFGGNPAPDTWPIGVRIPCHIYTVFPLVWAVYPDQRLIDSGINLVLMECRNGIYNITNAFGGFVTPPDRWFDKNVVSYWRSYDDDSQFFPTPPQYQVRLECQFEIDGTFPPFMKGPFPPHVY